MFANFKEGSTTQTVVHSIFTSNTLSSGFPNLMKLASVALVIPVTTAAVERSFSDMKLVKTRLRSQMGEDTLDYALRICIEDLDMLSDQNLEYNYYYPLERTKKASNVVNYVCFYCQCTFQNQIFMGRKWWNFGGKLPPCPHCR